MKRKYKGIIFDFNGVIVDDFEIQKKAWDEISIILRAKPLKKDEFFRNRGLRAEDFIKLLAKCELNLKKIENLIKKKEQLIKEQYKKGGKGYLFKGLIYFLDELKNQSIPITIVTSASYEMMKFYFKSLNLNKWFEWKDIVYNDGLHQGKPYPDPYLLGSNKLNLNPRECVVFEDAKSGIESAFKAGIGKIVAVGDKKQLKTSLSLTGVASGIENFKKLKLDNVLG